MKSQLTTVAIVAAAAAVFGTGGAVAGSLITGAQIKDGTVTGADVHNGALGTADLNGAVRSRLGTISAPTVVYKFSSTIAAGGTASLSVHCPAGRTAVSGQAGWNSSPSDAEAYPSNPPATWHALGVNTSGTPDTLYLTVVCVKTG